MKSAKEFEAIARDVWAADLSRAEKAKRLRTIRKEILRYVDQLDEKSLWAGLDPWRVLSYNRARVYLTQLASDTEQLATECESKATMPPALPYLD